MSSVLICKVGLDDGSQHEMPNCGMGILAAEFQRIGFTTTIVDGHFKPSGHLQSFIEHVDYLACSLVSLEWLVPETQAIISYAAFLGKKVIIGGPHAVGYWDLLMDDPRIWKIVVGEVDGQLERVFDSKEKVAIIGHAERIGTPDYSKMLYADEIVAYPISLSRGCTPGTCNFCAGAKAHGKWRQRNIDDAMAELAKVQDNHPRVRRIYVIDDCFTADLGHAKRFLERYIGAGYPRRYELQVINVRADQIDAEFLGLLKKAGCSILPIGVESGCHDVFATIGKGETLDDIYEGIKKIQGAALIPWLNMIVGLPHDTMETHERSVNWCRFLPDPKIVHWFQYAPFRGTRAYDFFLKLGCYEDGFIPSPYGRRYDELPWEPDFETKDFSKLHRSLAQLTAYLKCDSPVPIVSKKAEEMATKYVGFLWETWKERNAEKIEEYLTKYVPDKRKRGQL